MVAPESLMTGKQFEPFRKREDSKKVVLWLWVQWNGEQKFDGSAPSPHWF